MAVFDLSKPLCIFINMDSGSQKLLERITLKPILMGGRLTIRNMRYTVGDLLELLSSGMTEEEILKQHPLLELDDIKAALYLFFA